MDDKARENCWGANQFRTVVGRARIMMILLCNIVILVVGLVVVVVEDLKGGVRTCWRLVLDQLVRTFGENK